MSYKVVVIRILIFLFFIMGFIASILHINRENPSRWYGPKGFRDSLICIHKVNPQMRGFTFNDSVDVGNFYRDYHNRIIGDPSYNLDQNLKIGDCLQYTNAPQDSVYHINGQTGDTTLYLNLFPK